MEDSRFDLLLRKAGEQATRRETLGVLLGSALLLNAPGESDATKKAQRRKRQQRSAAFSSKPIALWLDNTAGTGPVTLTRGDNAGRGNCCNTINTDVIPAGGRVWLAFRRGGAFRASAAFMWIAGNDPKQPAYWLEFANLLSGLPFVKAAEDGVAELSHHADLRWCCFPEGETVLRAKGLNPNEFVNITIHDLVFNVRRNPDTNYKEFTVKLPAGL